jgi:hypothetical protein
VWPHVIEQTFHDTQSPFLRHAPAPAPRPMQQRHTAAMNNGRRRERLLRGALCDHVGLIAPERRDCRCIAAMVL